MLSHDRAVEIGRLGGIAYHKNLHDRCVRKYNLNPRHCKTCTTVIPYEKRRNTYCNHSCRAKTTNVGIVRNTCNRNLMGQKCLQCGSMIIGVDHPRKYCSSNCQNDHAIEERIRLGLPIIGRTIAKYLIRKRGHRCEICKNTTWNGKPITLEAHHIDGNFKNNALDNVQLTCPNCHSQTDNYKAKNKGNGRPYDKFR